MAKNLPPCFFFYGARIWGRPGDRNPEEEVMRAIAGDALAEDAVVLVQQEARVLVDERREARAPAGAFAAARAKLQEPAAEPLLPPGAGVLDTKAPQGKRREERGS